MEVWLLNRPHNIYKKIETLHMETKERLNHLYNNIETLHKKQ